MTIGIIGAGNMGTALCQAFIKNGVVDAQNVVVSDLNEEKLMTLAASLGVKTTQDLHEVISCDYVLIAVKPQGFSSLAEEIKGKILNESVLISVMAAVSIERIQTLTEHQKVVRCMPNTPALIGQGVLAWYANEEVGEESKTTVEELLESAGYAFPVEKETDINTIACISGSGPGFFYYIIEQWLKGTEHLEIPDEHRKKMLIKTLSGSLALAESSEEELSQLRTNVTSKGGITEAGLKVLEESGLDQIFEAMTKAASKRTDELSQMQ